MKVLITPPGTEVRYPLIIRLVMLLPIAKYKRRRLRSRVIRRLKPLLLTLYNLPKRMPDDFEFTYSYRVLKTREPERVTINFGKDVLKRDEVLNGQAVAPAIAAITIEQRQRVYEAIRDAGFIHFETNQNIEVSYDVAVQADYDLICNGRQYSYSSSTTEPTQQEWSDEEFELDEVINRIAGEIFDVPLKGHLWK